LSKLAIGSHVGHLGTHSGPQRAVHVNFCTTGHVTSPATTYLVPLSEFELSCRY